MSHEQNVDRRETHGIGRAEVTAQETHAPSISQPADGDRSVIVATGNMTREAAQQLAGEIESLRPDEHPLLTLDLRGATALDPRVVHALMHAWERRNREWGCIRLLVASGGVERFLDVLGLERAFDIVRDEDAQDAGELPVVEPPVLKEALRGAAEHYNGMLDAAHHHDLPKLQELAHQAHPVCIAAGAALGGPALGAWCQRCPMRHEYGGCQPLLGHLLKAAERDNWEAAELLILTLIAETVGLVSTGAGEMVEPL